MNTVKDEKVWGYSQKCLPETKRQNNFIHSGVKKKKKKDSSNLRKEEEKRKEGRGKSGRGCLLSVSGQWDQGSASRWGCGGHIPGRLGMG